MMDRTTFVRVQWELFPLSHINITIRNEPYGTPGITICQSISDWIWIDERTWPHLTAIARKKLDLICYPICQTFPTIATLLASLMAAVNAANNIERDIVGTDGHIDCTA